MPQLARELLIEIARLARLKRESITLNLGDLFRVGTHL
jgi:hypothetical protein